jgi:UDP-N-acetylglucosamine diphosphorylase/glucosamine-1-phosphate N-acetyltransferase
MKICIFEDFSVTSLSPVNYLRHTSGLICGALTLKEKIEHSLKGKNEIYLHCRKYLEDYCKEKYNTENVNRLGEGDYLFLNSRVIFTKPLLNNLKENNTAWVSGECIIAFSVTGGKTGLLNDKFSSDDNLITIREIQELGLDIIVVPPDEFKIINYPPALILYHGEELKNDLKILFKKSKKNIKKGLYISPKCKIHKSAVLDTSNGDIYIGSETTIEPFTYITGPCYIGEHSLIRAGSAIYGPVSIGNYCKLSGEITSSITHSYVNKQHFGFLGHSYLCEWVNLGAGTTTSNLKNNYSEIYIKSGSEKINTGSIFLGSVIGDHTKTGIQTMLNTGTMAGISCNIYGAGYHNNLIRSFTWDNASRGSIPYMLEKAVATAVISMKRRNVEMSEAYGKMFRHLFNFKDKILI